MGSTYGRRNHNEANNINTQKTLSKTPPTAQNVNPILTIFCNFTVDLRPNRCSCQETRPRDVLLSRNICVTTNQHGPRTHQRASHKHCHCHTHTVTSALKVACLHTYRTNHHSLNRRGPTGSPPTVLNLSQTSDFVKQKQRRARKGLTSQRYRTTIITMINV